MSAPQTQQKIALVTGSAKGIGAAIAIELARNGYGIVLHYRKSVRTATQTLTAVRQVSPSSSMLRADVTDARDVRRMIHLIIKRYGRLDVVVNTVGDFLYKPLARTTPHEWQQVMTSNLYSVIYMCSTVLPVLRKQRNGTIVNFGAAGALTFASPKPNTTPYHIAKAGVIAFTRQLARDNQSSGVRAFCVSPGIVDTSIIKPTGKTIVSKEKIARVVAAVVAGRKKTASGKNIEVKK